MDRDTATLCGTPKYLGKRNCRVHAGRGHQRGVVLAIVLLILAMMLATSAIWSQA